MLLNTETRIFNIQPEPIYYTRCPIYAIKQANVKGSVDLRDTDSRVDNQGLLGSCAANAIVNTYENMINRFSPEKFTDLSRLFLYYNTREVEKTISEDLGVSYLSNAFETLKSLGVCSEELWPYDASKFTIRPSDECYEDALSRKILEYEYISDDFGVKEILSNLEKPVVVGMRIFDGFMRANKENPIIDLPEINEVYLGGHAVSIVGYTEDDYFIIKNSFGSGWGDNGYALLSSSYMKNHVFDRWHMTLIEKNKNWLDEFDDMTRQALITESKIIELCIEIFS